MCVCVRECASVFMCRTSKSICMRPVLVIHMLGNQSWHLFSHFSCFLEQTIWTNPVMSNAKRLRAPLLAAVLGQLLC